MAKLKTETRVILIGGSSHVGKSTLGASLGARPGWSHISTDSLARHPGRPWSVEPDKVRTHVAEHYLTLSIDELVADVLRHYRSMWSGIEALIARHATDPDADRLVLEGSALWPESVAALDIKGVAAIWLTTSRDVFQARIKNASRLENKSGRDREMIEKFLARTLRYDEAMMRAVARLALASLDVETASSGDDLATRVLKRLES